MELMYLQSIGEEEDLSKNRSPVDGLLYQAVFE